LAKKKFCKKVKKINKIFNPTREKCSENEKFVMVMKKMNKNPTTLIWNKQKLHVHFKPKNANEM